MTNYEKLVEALRCENTGDDECGSSDCPYWSGLGCMYGQLMEDAADAIEKLVTLYEKAEIDATNLTGKLAQAEAQLQKRGKWVEDTTTYAGPGLSNYKCSLCGKIGGTWRRGLKLSELPNWCGYCGADLRAKGRCRNERRTETVSV